MLSAGVDYGIEKMCIGEKRKLTLPAKLGLAGIEYGSYFYFIFLVVLN